MDKASVSDTGDCRFKSCQGRFLYFENKITFWYYITHGHTDTVTETDVDTGAETDT